MGAPLRAYASVGSAEAAAVAAVVQSGTLSGFYGSWGDQFLGGPKVKEFERAWAHRFGIEHAVSVNSATSGLIAAIGACGITPGDEVIVPPFTMSATVVAPLFYGGIPVFADIDEQTFTLDVDDVRRKIGPRTRAVLAVNLFGHAARLEQLRRIADDHDLWLIEDNAQAPLAKEGAHYAGTIGDIGVFSLNYHKHIHTGEGGMCTTNDDDLAVRLQMIRNHGENVVEALGIEDATNLLGFNFRMTELSAAVGLVQLDAIERHVARRCKLAETLTRACSGLDGITPTHVRDGCTHVYYLWTLRLDRERLGVSRDLFSKALAAEGFPHFNGYLRPLYMLPAFQRRCAFGNGWPFSLSDVAYEPGNCPVAERMYATELLCFEVCAHEASDQDAELLGECIRKVHRNRFALAEWQATQARG
jgi:dTDP-4-amino-4,6-dideoxygalactose transaminase